MQLDDSGREGIDDSNQTRTKHDDVDLEHSCQIRWISHRCQWRSNGDNLIAICVYLD